MSKALGKKLIRELGLGSNVLSLPVTCKYVAGKSKDGGEFVFDVPMYTEGLCGLRQKVRISESGLGEMMCYDGKQKFVDKENGGEYAFEKSIVEMKKEELGLVESSGGLLCMDELEVLSIAMCCVRVNEVEMKKVKKAVHLRRLGRLESSVVTLVPMKEVSVLCGEGRSSRGRKLGSGNKISEEDWAVMVYNFSHYDEIVENCLKHDWFDEFYMLEKDCTKVSGANGGKVDRKKVVEKWRELRGKTAK